jgi:ankyrin repeat protein
VSALAAVAAIVAGLHAVPRASQSLVADAAMSGDHETARRLLREGADVNAAQGDGMTALHWAALRGDTDLVAMLLYAGANTRATTRLGGYTPLHLASQAGRAAAVGALLLAGAAADTPTTTGATALMLAAGSGSADAVRALADHGASLDAVEAAQGQTALMFAAALDRVAVVRLLLERGADAARTSAVVDLSGVESPEEKLQEQLREATRARGASETGAAAPAAPKPEAVPGVTRPFKYNELIGGHGGLTALHFAARQGSAATVDALLAHGVDVDRPSPADGITPLLITTINGHFDLAATLLAHGADPNRASDAGMTALYAVVNVEWAPRSFYPQPRAHLQQKLSYLDLMKTLLEAGADPNSRLHRKVWYTQYNFDLLRLDESGATPFWRAAYASDIEAMKLLVAFGADHTIATTKPAKRDIFQAGTRGTDESKDHSGLPPVPIGGPGIPPLLAAAGAGYGEGFAGNAHRFAPTGMLAAVTYLVEELGADVNAVDHEGNTAVHHAAARGDNEMIRYLVGRGADVTRVNRGGQTTVDMANGPVQRIQPFPETVALLEGLGAKNNHRCVSC